MSCPVCFSLVLLSDVQCPQCHFPVFDSNYHPITPGFLFAVMQHLEELEGGGGEEKEKEEEARSPSEFIQTCDVVIMDPDRTCAICLNSMFKGVRMHKCKHVYHEECIAEWLAKKFTCPMCRETVT